MKKILMLLAASAVLTLAFLAGTVSAYADSGDHVDIDKSHVDSGRVDVKYEEKTDNKVKLMVEKSLRYTYNLKAGSNYEAFPLQMGDGEYKVSVLENIGGTKYRFVHSEKLSAQVKDEAKVYLNSIQMVRWDSNTKAVKKAVELTSGKKTDQEKIKALYDYVVKLGTYDYDKLGKLPYNYLPDADRTIAEKSGVCYDFASLLAVMLRSQGIPVKLVMGYTENVEGYHAWNEIYNSKTGLWMTVDATYDLQMRAAKVKTVMEKDVREYSKKYEY